jgi:hypothetical protein
MNNEPVDEYSLCPLAESKPAWDAGAPRAALPERVGPVELPDLLRPGEPFRIIHAPAPGGARPAEATFFGKPRRGRR